MLSIRPGAPLMVLQPALGPQQQRRTSWRSPWLDTAESMTPAQRGCAPRRTASSTHLHQPQHGAPPPASPPTGGHCKPEVLPAPAPLSPPAPGGAGQDGALPLPNAPLGSAWSVVAIPVLTGRKRKGMYCLIHESIFIPVKCELGEPCVNEDQLSHPLPHAADPGL